MHYFNIKYVTAVPYLRVKSENPPAPLNKLITRGTLALTDKGVTCFETLEHNNLLEIPINLIETQYETGILTID